MANSSNGLNGSNTSPRSSKPTRHLDRQKFGLVRSVKRTSNLEAPSSAEILSCRFDPTGQNIAACSADRSVSLWRTYSPNTNYDLLPSFHKAPILDLHWSLYSPTLYTVSADHVLGFTDVTTGQRVRKIRAHRGIINALDRTMAGRAGIELVVTGSHGGSVRVWEGDVEGSKQSVASPFPRGTGNAETVYMYRCTTYGKTKRCTPPRDTDTPTSLALSPNGSYLLSPSFSSQTIIHDVRPFSPSPSRIHRVLQGAPAGFENTLLKGAWSKDDEGRRVAVGGADRMVCIWEVESGRVLYKLPGHKGTVTSVDFHPKEPIILTASKDATMLMGEIEQSLVI
ncbi:WD40 repeat-like protein [Imleria badia]|nr:WD40 repeat-like protein [Imleria badia]